MGRDAQKTPSQITPETSPAIAKRSTSDMRTSDAPGRTVATGAWEWEWEWACPPP